jgi:membrane protease YdiL (CAAX protease family)
LPLHDDRVPAPLPADAARLAHPRLAAAIEVVLCSGIPTQLAIAALLALAGLMPSGTDGPPPAAFVITLLLADTCAVVALMVLFMRARGERPAAVWLGGRPVSREVVVGLWLIPVVFLLVVVILNTVRLVAPWLHDVPVNPFEQMAGSSSLDAALLGLAAILAGGVREELQRAFLLHRFEQHLGGRVVGVLVLSAGFGLAHISQGRDAVIATGALGLFWAIVYLRRRSAVAPLVSHAGFNAMEILRVAA